MTQQVILLRGINVGGHNQLPMKALCTLLSDLGAQNPRTYIQSGNAVVQGKVAAEALAESIAQTRGFRPNVLVLAEAKFKAIVDACPFEEPEGKKLHIWFAASPATFDIEAAVCLKHESEQIHATPQAIYLHAPNGIGRSKLAGKIEKLSDARCTARNMNTVQKLLDMLQNPA